MGASLCSKRSVDDDIISAIMLNNFLPLRYKIKILTSHQIHFVYEIYDDEKSFFINPIHPPPPSSTTTSFFFLFSFSPHLTLTTTTTFIIGFFPEEGAIFQLNVTGGVGRLAGAHFYNLRNCR